MVTNILSANQMAIGATNPFSYQLYVNGRTNLASDVEIGGALYVRDGAMATPSITFDVDRDTGLYRSALNRMAVVTGGSSRMTIDNTGVGIGITIPNAPLQIVSGTQGIMLGKRYGNDIQGCAGTGCVVASNLVLQPYGGNVGIGTESPGTNKLEGVGGPIKATGGLIIETRAADPPSPVTGQMWLIT